MAKNTSSIFKLQGTIDDKTFVNSRTYGPHVRSKRNSKTPFVLTPALAAGQNRMQACNNYAQPIFQALRAESRDGMLWSRLIKLFSAEVKAGRPLSVQCLKKLECNLQHPLSEVLAGGYEISATREQSSLRIRALLHMHPETKGDIPRVGYQLRFLVIVPDAAADTAHKREVLSDLTPYDADLKAVELTVELPPVEEPCMLVMGIVPHVRKDGPIRLMSDSGMRVVWVG